MPNSRFFELLDHVGLAPSHTIRKDKHGVNLEVPNDGSHGRPAHGEPEPLSSISVSIPVPVKVGDDILTDVVPVKLEPSEEFHEHLEARIIPGTRIVECRHPALGELLINSGHYREVDQPKSEQPRKPKGQAGGSSNDQEPSA